MRNVLSCKAIEIWYDHLSRNIIKQIFFTSKINFLKQIIVCDIILSFLSFSKSINFSMQFFDKSLLFTVMKYIDFITIF